MSYIVVGDTHVGCKKSSKAYLQSVISLFTEIQMFAQENDVKGLIHTGDFFDNRKALTHDAIETAMYVADIVDKTFDVSYFIVGNHDTPSKDTMFPHSLIMFKEYKNIVVVSDVIIVDGIMMCPWMFPLHKLKQSKGANICIGHFDINGATMNSSGTISRNHLLNFSDFSNFDLTMSGHYHTPKTYTHNVRYIGSPYQITFNDMGSTRGFYHLAEDKMTMDFIRFDDYPHHFSYTDNTTNIADIEGHIVRLVFTADHGIDRNKEIINRFKDLKPMSLRVKYARLDEGMTEEKVNESVMVKSKLEILNDFHEKSSLPENINMGLLNKVSASIYKEMTGDA